MKKCSAFILLICSICSLGYSQPDTKYNAAEIKEAIKKLDVLGSVLYIAAHPDDENTRLITYLSKEKLYNTAYLSLTRGDGGQNLIGSELNEELGLIRTQELLAARKIDGGKQFFSRANDFGFSKNPDETFEVWNKEEVLADMVWVIRKFQPDIFITRFNTEPGRTHGHHTASTLLALEAFDAAADPSRFPEQLKYLSTWQTKRIFWNTNSWFFVNPNEFKPDSLLKIDVGSYNASLGKSYTEIAAESRSMHKSQGFGTMGVRGEQIEYLELLKGDKARSDIFDHIETSWKRVTGSEEISNLISKIYKEFNINEPARSVESLIQLRKLISRLPESYYRNLKLEETDKIIKACLGLWVEAVAGDFSAVPGSNINVTTEIINRSREKIVVEKINYFPSLKDSNTNFNLSYNTIQNIQTTITIPKNFSYTHPYWLKEKGTVGMFQVTDQNMIGLPENPAPVYITIDCRIFEEKISFSTPLIFKKSDPVKGEVYRPFEITPPVFINSSKGLLMFGDTKPKSITVTLQAGESNQQGKLVFDIPAGWKILPAEIPFTLGTKGSEYKFQIQVVPPALPNSGELKLKAILKSDTVNHGIRRISYDHIPTQTLFPLATVRLNRLDIKKKGEKIGYIAGAGDDVSSALQDIGYDVTLINESAATLESLKRFDAIITGIRAFNTNEKLKTIHPILLQYVKGGGTLIVQYNTVPNRIVAGSYVTDSIGPYPITLSRDRVTKENAEVRFLNPLHPLLNRPNKITEKDFENWVQERGLYFPSSWSKEYTPVISMNDPGETPKDGSILFAKYGKGVFIYTGISWFRQLPAGVPGAYRIFVNLISAGK